MPERPLGPRAYGLGLASIALAALALRLWRLGATGFWVDEIYSVRLTEMAFAEMATRVPPDKPVLDYVLQWLVVRPGAPEWVARLPAAIYGALAVPAVASIARWLGARRGVRSSGDRAAGLCAAAIVAAAPYAIRYSQEARPYALVFLCVAAALGCLLRAQARGAPLRSPSWYGAVLFFVMATYTLFFGWLPVGVVFVCLATQVIVARAQARPAQARLAFGRAASLAGATLVLNAPFLMRLATAARTASHAPFDVDSVRALVGYVNLLGAAWDQRQGLWIGPIPSVAVFLPFALWGLAAAMRRAPWRGAMVAAVWLGGAGLAAGFLAWRDHWLHARYLYFAMPGYYALLGLGAAGAGRWLARRAAKPVVQRLAFAAPVAMLTTAALVYAIAAGPFERPSWREWAAEIATRELDSSRVEFIGLEYPDVDAMRYYLRREGLNAGVRRSSDWRNILARARSGRTFYVAGADRETPAPRPPRRIEDVRIEALAARGGLHAWRVAGAGQ